MKAQSKKKKVTLTQLTEIVTKDGVRRGHTGTKLKNFVKAGVTALQGIAQEKAKSKSKKGVE